MNEALHNKLNEWLSGFGASVDKVLGSGSYASVYSLNGSDLVVKVTEDFDEIPASDLVMKAQANGLGQGIVKIMARKLERSTYGATYLFLLEEKLTPLPEPLITAMDYVLVNNIAIPGLVYSRCRAVWNPDYVDSRYATHPGLKGRWEPENWTPLARAWTWGNAAALNLRAIQDSCKEVGIKSHGDWHAGNIMVRPGYGVVLSDLGRTST